MLLVLLLAGCNQFRPGAALQAPPVVRGLAPQPEVSSIPQKEVKSPVLLQPVFSQPIDTKALPITLDTVLRLAQDQNGQVALAREKLQEAFANKDLAGKRWIPDLFVGPSFYRHEGGIQDFQGNLIHSSYGALFAGMELRGLLDLREAAYQKIDAERKVLQKMGELDQFSSENLLDAASTYVDLLAAQSALAVAFELEKKLRSLLEQAQNLAKVEPGSKVEVARILSEITGQRQITRKLQENTKAASAKLVHLLGLDPSAELIPLDRKLIPFNLVEDNVSTTVLVDQALSNGPGIRALQGLLALIDEANERSQGLGRLFPVLQMNVAEGAFGAGPGSSSNWDNRFDLALQARWNLTDLITRRERQRLTQSKMQQAQLGYQELRSKLTLGVKEAQEASLSSREQLQLGETQIKHAEEAYTLSKNRFLNIKGAAPSEVLLAIRALGGAHLNYINAIRDHDKAQLRLFVLTGRVDATDQEIFLE